MRNYDEVIKNVRERTEEYEQKVIRREKGIKYIVSAMAVVMVGLVTVIGYTVARNASGLGDNKTVSITSTPTPTKEPMDSRPIKIYAYNAELMEGIANEWNGNAPNVSEMVIGSSSLQEAIDETTDEELYFPILIHLYTSETAKVDIESALADAVESLQAQGIYVIDAKRTGIRVLMNKGQIESLQVKKPFGYLLTWDVQSAK